MGAPQGSSLDAPRGTGQANMVPSLRLDAGMSGMAKNLMLIYVTISACMHHVM